MSRFRLPLDPPTAGEQLIAGMRRCKIELSKSAEGDVWCDVEIGGAVDGDTTAGLALLHTLIAEFRKPAAEGGVV